MDRETHALVRYLFAEVTVALETAQGLAVEGQDVERRPASGLALVTGLESSLADAASLLAATRVLLRRAAESRAASGQRRRRSRPT